MSALQLPRVVVLEKFEMRTFDYQEAELATLRREPELVAPGPVQ